MKHVESILNRFLPLLPALIFMLIVIYALWSTNQYNQKINILSSDKIYKLKLLALNSWFDEYNTARFKKSIASTTSYYDASFEALSVIKTRVSHNEDLKVNFFLKLRDIKSEVRFNFNSFSRFVRDLKTDTTLYFQLLQIPEFKFVTEKEFNLYGEVFLSTLMFPPYLKDFPDFHNYVDSLNSLDLAGLIRADTTSAKFDLGLKLLAKYNEELFIFNYDFLKEFRYENILILMVTAFLLTFIAYQIPKIGFKSSKQILVTQEIKRSIDLPDILLKDLKISEEKSNELYNRSSIMLVSGIIMSIVGILVFALSIPDTERIDKDNLLTSFTIQAVRPTLTLIFIESIAFFLLRQYRILIEDFKYFHKLYLKRLNYAESFQLREKYDYKKHKTLIDSLLNEELDSRLAEGESTENLEAIKNTENQDPALTLKLIVEALKKQGVKI
ncbi:hypothetical protein QQ008_18010 [Fulvivirgaceae bacterium BMA10]|uniref:Uncharacterized protein n=1 Tax=Splendidivirga corallicola TaxID=3051826 RepID=A0ABT8KRB8_9BACT|nr:hypothetical protein [Fulvivirgaceae bacterium BMA10]